MNNSTRNIFCIASACIASALLAASLTLPVWKMRMDAPQYQGNEALKVSVYPGKMTGDLDEIQHIQQYVGVRIPSELPQLRWLPAVLVGAAIVGLAAAFLPIVVRRRALIATATAICVAIAIAAVMAQSQMYTIGHERTHSPLARVQSFTPPLLGDMKFANFHIKSRLSWGSLFIGAAVLLQLAAAKMSARTKKTVLTDRPVLINPHPSFQRTLPAKNVEGALTAYEI